MRANTAIAILLALGAVSAAPIEAGQASDLSQLGDNAVLGDNAQQTDNVQLTDNAELSDNAELAENGELIDHAEAFDLTLFANATLLMDAAELEGAAQEADLSALDVEGGRRKKDIKYDGAAPGRENCPASNNGRGRNYPAHKYTQKQLQAAFRTGAVYQSAGKTVGEQRYPHNFGNREALEFECGQNKMEFPILTDGTVYRGGDVERFPDRLVYEWKQDKTYLRVKFCGVIRHGPGSNFISCRK